MIEAVILYSTNDQRFHKECISNLLEAGVKCHVVTYSHMWKGQPEDLDKLSESAKLFEGNSNYNQYYIEWEPGKDPWYWEGIGRYLATQEVGNDSKYILYIDIDEIVEADKLKQFIEEQAYNKYDSLKIPNYWYWRTASYRATDHSDSIVMLKTSLAKQIRPTAGGREIYFSTFQNRTRLKLDNPFIHHYSWVRTKEEMLAKVSNWGHASDKGNWVDLVEEEFSRPFNGKCFLNDRTFEEVEPTFNI